MGMEEKLMLGEMIGMLGPLNRAELMLACFTASLKTGDFEILERACRADTDGNQQAQRATTLKLLAEVLPMKERLCAIMAEGKEAKIRQDAKEGRREMPVSFTPDFAR